MNLNPDATFLRFLIAGAFNTLFGWTVYSFAIFFGARPWLALIIGLTAGIAFNFISLSTFVFRNMVLKRLPLFVLSYGFIYTINLICLEVIQFWIDSPIWGQLVLSPPISILSYLVLSRTVFKQENAPPS
ncbi:hypothetical protein FACS1894154_09820 [Betaproteobacteria bacterium]|nr:hypothetical protein FACS1894154_09820 [Betaproteobacteria bacterium]